MSQYSLVKLVIKIPKKKNGYSIRRTHYKI